MVPAYGDESMDEKRQRVCAVAIVYGPEERWKALDVLWSERTGKKRFHAKDCEASHRDYAARAGEDPKGVNQRNKALYRDLTILVAQSGLYGFASVIDVAAHSEVFGHSRGTDRHFYGAFINTIRPARDYARSVGDIAEFTFDTRVESEHNAGLMYGYLRESHPEWRDHIGKKVSFVSSEGEPRLQAADLFAREAMKEVDNAVGPTKRDSRKSWIALAETDRFGLVYTGREEAEIVRHEAKFMENYLGFTMSDYVDWLHAHNRQPSRTAEIEFVAMIQKRRREGTQ